MKSQQAVLAVAMVAFVGVGTSACATKGFVNRQVGQVSSKVDTLGQSLEATQERTRQNEARIGEVDTKAGAAGTAANAAGTAASAANAAAGAADQKAVAANTVATAASTKVEAVEKAARRIVFEVVLSENQGNFKFGQAVLPAEAKAKIDEMVTALLADPKGAYFEIEGHTDNVGDKMVNDKIGMDRAESVKRYLYEQYKIPLHRMNVISYGKDKPAGPNNTAKGRAENRRVVIRVLA